MEEAILSGDRILITCEHGGNAIPDAYVALFAPYQDLLATHRGYDFGALALAEQMAAALQAPLFASTTSRLLVDLNRSIGNSSLHSEATRGLPLAERRRIVDAYWRPHRDRVEGHVAGEVRQGHRVVHVASHSFTPELHGEVRNADIGLLYDPRRAGEGVLARLWKAHLERLLPSFRVRLNYPYAGRGDGLTLRLRKEHDALHYVGIEFELNQKHVGPADRADAAHSGAIVASLGAALADFAREQDST